MGLAIKVRQGGDAGAALLDVSAGVPLFIDHEAQVTTSSAYGQGQGSQGTFVFHDEAGEVQDIGVAQLLGHNQVTITEDASGSAYWLMRGRISLHDASRATGAQVQAARQHAVTVDDINSELHGIILTAPWERTAETGLERFIAAIEEFASGAASDYTKYRPSTVITAAREGDGHLMFPHPTDGEVTMEVRTGDDAYPIGTSLVDILRECAETEGQNWGVVIHDTAGSSHACMLYMEEDDFTAWPSTLSISDVISEVDNETVFFPWWRTGAAVEQDGGDVLSYVVTEWGDERLTSYAENLTTVTKFDVWGEKINDATSQTQAGADLRAGHLLAGKSREDVTHQPTLILPADKVHLVRAGMSIQIKARASRDQEGIGQTATRIIAQVKLTPYSPELTNGERFYIADLQLARPKKIARERRPPRKGPRAPRPPVAGDILRLYLTNHNANTSEGSDSDDAPEVTKSGIWETGITQTHMLNTEPQTSVNGITDFTAGDTNDDVALYVGVYELDAAWAEAIADGGATIEGRIRANARYGTGVNEGVQDHISQMTVRITQGATASIRGTALAAHSLTSSAGSSKWPAQATKVNRVFPPAAASNTLSAVSGTVAGDYIVIEIGYRTFNASSTPHGGGVFISDSAASDLPSDEVTTANLNSWFELRSPDAAGDETEPTVLPGEGTTGENTGVYAPIDHTHAHGLLSSDGDHHHDASTIEYDPTESGLAATDVQQAIDAIVTGLSSTGTTVVDHGSMGAAETFDFSDGTDHEGTLDANLTVTLAGAVATEAAYMTLVLTQDSGGGNTIDLPASVANAADIEAAFDTTGDAVNVLTVFSYDGGTTWYAFLAGGDGAGAVAAEDVSITDSGGYFTGTDVEAALQELGAGGGGSAGHYEVLMASGDADPLETSDGLDWLYVFVPD